MNQIIYTRENNNLKNMNEQYRKKPKKKNLLKIEFYILIIISISLLIYYINFRYNLYDYERLSKDLAKSFELTKIYNTNSDYNT